MAMDAAYYMALCYCMSVILLLARQLVIHTESIDTSLKLADNSTYIKYANQTSCL